MASGGYRTPANPAPVSGPGRLSKRTDGGPGQKLMAPTGMDYGDHKALMDQERTAAMSQADPIAAAPVPAAPDGGLPAGPQYQGAAMGDPTQRPNEPVTHGVDIGAGAGSMVLPPSAQPQFQSQGPMTKLLSQLSGSDQSGALTQLFQSALAVGA